MKTINMCFYRFSIVSAVILFFTIVVRANDESINVLSYYAVTNSLDGQPVVDKINVLRFYPVYALRDSVKSVKITVYYGGSVNTRAAQKLDYGRYWEIHLPKFQLGEAIQRIDVETDQRIPNNKLIDTYLEIRNNVSSVGNILKMFENIKNLKDEVNIKYNDHKKVVESFDRNNEERIKKLDSVCKYLSTLESKLSKAIDSCSKVSEPSTISDNTKQLKDILTKDLTVNLENYNKEINSLDEKIKPNKGTLHEISFNLFNGSVFLGNIDTNNISNIVERVKDLQGKLYQLVYDNLTDTNYAGLGVKKSDIIVDSNFTHAKILYRNYKVGLRQLPALDPSERLSVFKTRYIPFAVVGNKGLRKSTDGAANTIFEIGLSFGDQIVSGDEFVLEPFAARRLGVAFAVTPELFGKEAEVTALVLTYDFNSFGSIGIGANFPPSKPGVTEGYFSFGINRRAFEKLMGEIQKIFE
ncbi:MAG: hypothetical protein U0Y96_00975 [Candidatus Kapaibacterium sp.]